MTNISEDSLWRLTHSLWILWTLLFGFFSWVAFFYIGFRTRQRKWVLWGLLYSTSFLSLFVIGPDHGYLIYLPEDSWLTNLQIIYFFSLWIISMIHALLVRREYLIRLETVKEINREPDEYLKRKYMQEYSGNKEKTYYKSQNSFNEYLGNDKIDNNKKTLKNSSKPIDINNDPEEVITELPGVDILLAKRAIEIRKSTPFKSIHDFGEALGLKPHIIERIKPLIIIKSQLSKNDQNSEIQESGRLVDY